MSHGRRKVLVIGLDCLTPELVFGDNLDNLPNIKRLLESGVWGRLKSTIPPITCPAWMSMMTGKDPGRIGCYGMRNRRNYTYDSLRISTSVDIKEDAVWDILSKNGKKVIIIGVPQTYPPREVNGFMVSGFLTPDISSEFTYPKDLKQELKEEFGDYLIDIRDYRTDNKESILKEIYALSNQRFKLAKYMIEDKEWDFLIFVDMGPDRLHHGFWKFHDKTHRKYEKGNRYENVIIDYYRFLDTKIGELLDIIDSDTIVFIVSDHGAKKLDGGFCINEWLKKEGYLKLNRYPPAMTRFDAGLVRWQDTFAWGEGGYYGRIFLNVKGREPQGIIDGKDYERVRDEIIGRLSALDHIDGTNLDTRVFKPQEVYWQCKNIPPDLIIYFDNLNLRSIGSFGYDNIYTFENDTGPDDSNHAEHGIFIMSGKGIKPSQLNHLSILDVAPTILSQMEMAIPPDMQGRAIRR